MSFWDQYLAPGDVRNAKQPMVEEKASQLVDTVKEPEPVPRLDSASRARRQDGLLYGGIVFSALAVLITRRSVARKIRLNTPALELSAGVTPQPAGKAAGSLDAAEALSLATLNVVGFGMLAAGAIAKIFDVSELEDLRNGIRRGVGFDVYGGDAAADKELEEWVAENIMSQKDGPGLRAGLTQKLAELERFAKERPSEQPKK